MDDKSGSNATADGTRVGKGYTGLDAARGATYLLIQGVIGNLTGVVYYAFAARLLPNIADFGRLSTLTLVETLFSTLSSVILPSAFVKFIAEYLGREKRDDAHSVLRSALRFGVMASLVSSTVCLLASGPISQYLFGGPEYGTLVYLLSLDIPLMVFSPFLHGVLQGLQRFGAMASIALVGSVLRHGLAVLVLYFGIGLQGVVLGWIVSDMFIVLLLLVVSLRELGGRKTHHPLRPLIRYSVPLYVSAVLTFFIGSIDRFLILFLSGQVVLGLYSPAVTAMSVLLLFSNAFGGVLFPQLSERYGRLGDRSLRDVSRTSSRYIFMFYIPLALGLAATANPIMALFVGESYLESALPLAVLSIASAVACGSIISNNVLLAIGRTGIFSVVGIVSVATNLGLSFLLIGPLGTAGAALARASVTLVTFLVPALALTKMYGQHLDLTAFVKSLTASSVMALVVFGLQLFWLSKYFLPLYAFTGGLVYMGMLRLLKVLGEDDFYLMGSFVPKWMQRPLELAKKFLL